MEWVKVKELYLLNIYRDIVSDLWSKIRREERDMRRNSLGKNQGLNNRKTGGGFETKKTSR